jgi:hypothetical protein
MKNINSALDMGFAHIKPEHLELLKKAEDALQGLSMEKLQEVLNYIDYMEFRDIKKYDAEIENTEHKEVFYPELQE